MKKAFNKMMYGAMLYGLLFIILGVILFVKPDIANKVIGYMIGGILVLSGFNSVIKYYTNKNRLTFFNFELSFGILSVLFGIFVIFKPFVIASFLVVILGLWMIFSGAIKIQYSLELKRYKEEYWWITLIVSFLTLMFGVILMFNPLSSTMVLSEIIGIFVILYGILDIMEAMILKKNVNSIIKLIKK